jgi:mannose-6-phosphate isomerase-like protein (cupin superfamily)
MQHPTNRRDLVTGLAAFAALATLSSEAAAQTAAPNLVHSEIFPFDSLPVKHNDNGGESRAILQGTLATGEFIEVHETSLPPGQMPHAPHRHTHSEVLLIREGKVQVLSDGKQGTVGPGSVIFTASGVLHSLKNVGDVMAKYFVVAVGIQKAIV